MSKFTEKKAEIKEKAAASNRKTFNETEFNELATALINEPDYETSVIHTVQGEYTEEKSYPVKGLRKAIIGGVAKAAGCDSAEQAKLVAEHQFSTLPIHEYISEVIEQYMDAGKAMTLVPKKDLRASISIEAHGEEKVDVKSPKTQEVKTRKYSAYRKVKVKSNCPQNLREDI